MASLKRQTWCGSMGKGGWIVQEIDEKYLKKLAECAPDLPPIVFKIAVSRLQNEGDDPTLGEVNKELRKITDAADKLADAISNLSFGALDHIQEAELRHGRQGLKRALKASLTDFAGIAEVGRRIVEERSRKGRDFEENTVLVSQLAGALQTNGAEVNAKSQGQLVWAFQLALDAAGKPSVANASDTVRKALAKLRKE
jgi:hypothetical protein